MTTREITKQQFSDGTTIDSDRLDKMNSEVADYFNEVSQRPITNKWVPTRYVWGYCPHDTTGEVGVDNEPGPGANRPDFLNNSYYRPFVPWLPVVNNRNTTGIRQSSSVLKTPGNENIINPERYKAYLAQDKFPTGQVEVFSPIDEIKNQFSWEVGWSSAKPQIIKEFSVVFDKTDVFPTSVLYSIPGWTREQNWTTGPQNALGEGVPLSSVVLEILVLSPTNPSRREEGFVVWSRSQMRLEGETFCAPDPNNIPPGAPSSTFLPNFNEVPDGLWFRQENLDISVPAGSQVICAVILPDYQEVNYFYPEAGVGVIRNEAWWSSMTDTNQSYTMTITALEETESYE